MRCMWDETQAAAENYGATLPDWDTFLAGGIVELPDPTPDRVFLSEFRADPIKNRRATPSGRIELFSETVAGFDLQECTGHATWNLPRDQVEGQFPIALISGQPGTRLHSQFDNGSVSLSSKIKGLEPVRINPVDAEKRGIKDRDIVELFNKRGRCLAGAHVTDDVMQGVVFLWTGAWYDPDFDATDHRDRHGNPNVLTHDHRTSEFSQSPASHSAQVEVAKYENIISDVMAFEPPKFVIKEDI